jgi:hypothetical protein
MQTGRKPVYNCLRVFLVILLLLLMPVSVFAGTQLNFQWDPNPEPDIAGYRVFSRQPGQDYDYDNPVWEGQESYCSIFVDDEDAIYLFVVRAFDEDGFESDDSNEVVYPDDSRYLKGSGSSSEGGCFIGTLK